MPKQRSFAAETERTRKKIKRAGQLRQAGESEFQHRARQRLTRNFNARDPRLARRTRELAVGAPSLTNDKVARERNPEK